MSDSGSPGRLSLMSKRSLILGASALLLVLVLVPALAAAQPTPAPPPPAPAVPDRRGATFELSLGLGLTRVALDDGPSESFTGLSGLNVGVGGWISPGPRSRSASPVRRSSSPSRASTSASSPVWSVCRCSTWRPTRSGSAAVSASASSPRITTTSIRKTALGLDLRAGFNLYQSAQHALHLAVEVTPGFFDGLTVTGLGLQLGWQRL